MSPPVLTALFAGLLALVYCVLAARVIRARREARISLGVADDPVLLRRSRIHANFSEYVPIILILMGLSEILGAHWAVILLLGAMTGFARVSHALAIDRDPQILAWRVRGMQMTLAAVVIGAVSCLIMAVRHLYLQV